MFALTFAHLLLMLSLEQSVINARNLIARSSPFLTGRLDSVEWNDGLEQWNGTVQWNGGMDKIASYTGSNQFV